MKHRKSVSGIIALTIIISLADIGMRGVNTSAAAVPVPKLGTTSKSIAVGASFKLNVKKTSKVKAVVKTEWSVNRKKTVELSAKKKTSVKVTGKSEGTAKVTAKVTYRYEKGKKETKKLTCSVKVTSNVTPAPSIQPTASPVPSVQPTASPASTVQPTASAPARTEISDMAKVKEVIDKYYAANKQETIFKKYKTVEMTSDYKFETDDNFYKYYYIAPDYEYMELESYVRYMKNDGTGYGIYGIGKEWNPKTCYEIDVTKDYKLHDYWMIDANYEGSYDGVHEKVTSCYVEDDLIHLWSRYDEEFSKMICENRFNMEYTGMTVVSEVIMDAENYELKNFNDYIEKDGKNQPMISETIRYGEPESEKIRNMRAFFERSEERTMKITVIARPDTDSEVTKEIVIPANSDYVIFCSDIPDFEYYEDRECTKVMTEHWDRNSDDTVYIAAAKD